MTDNTNNIDHQMHVPQESNNLNVEDVSQKIKHQFLDLYNSGVNLFSIAKYNEAKQKFLDCMIYGYESDKCLKSIASCCQMLEEYDEAINFYKVALLYNESANVDCYQFIGVCAVKAKRFGDAVNVLEIYLSAVGDDGDNPERIKSAKLYLNIANKKLTEKNNEDSELE